MNSLLFIKMHNMTTVCDKKYSAS